MRQSLIVVVIQSRSPIGRLRLCLDISLSPQTLRYALWGSVRIGKQELQRLCEVDWKSLEHQHRSLNSYRSKIGEINVCNVILKVLESKEVLSR